MFLSMVFNSDEADVLLFLVKTIFAGMSAQTNRETSWNPVCLSENDIPRKRSEVLALFSIKPINSTLVHNRCCQSSCAEVHTEKT